VYSIADEKRAEAIALIKLSKTLSDKAFPGAVFLKDAAYMQHLLRIVPFTSHALPWPDRLFHRVILQTPEKHFSYRWPWHNPATVEPGMRLGGRV
jgi:hypothetical protein